LTILVDGFQQYRELASEISVKLQYTIPPGHSVAGAMRGQKFADCSNGFLRLIQMCSGVNSGEIGNESLVLIAFTF
jgi:hypothetical protein